MKKSTREDLSTLVDGELDSTRASQVIEAATRDPKLRAAWSRYHLMSDAMRDQLAPGAPAEFAERVRRALESEPPLAAPRRRAHALAKPLAGLALAASVAGVAILGLNALRSEQPAAPQTTAVARQTPQESGTALRWNVGQPAVEARLNGYLVNHSEYLGNGMRGLLPYARIVGYDGEEDTPRE